MSNVFNLVSEETYIEQTDKLAVYLAAIAAKGDGTLRPTSWTDVQSIVRNGLASKVFAIGDQLTCQRGNDTLVWDIIGIDHDTPVDPQFTHSMTLQLHDCFPTVLQFDAAEAFYYAENGLAAGTYHFLIDGTDYQFTLADDVAAGSQLILNFTGNTPTSIFVSETVGGDFVKDTNGTNNLTIAVTPGSGGDKLLGVNNVSRTRYGSNNYKESAIRQWLNSSAVAGFVWSPQTNFGRPPLWTENTAGFMNGMDADFLAVIGKTAKVTVRNTVTDGGGYDETDDYFFLPSRSEIYGGVEVSGVDEGEPYPYYSDYSDLSVAGIGNDSNRIKYKSGAAQSWWCRTPTNGSSYTVHDVYPKGNVIDNRAYVSVGVAPACNII